jgi:ATP-dependent RNA helicase DeaD
MTCDVHEIMKRYMRQPVMVETKPMVDPTKLKQQYLEIYEQRDKFAILVHFLKHETPGLALVFCATRTESDIIARNLRANGINAMAIHGGMSQNKREDSLSALKKENIDVLVATDVAARGLDIKNVTHVYNYDVPKTPKEYIHRIGRTARAGEKGDAVTLLTVRDHDNFRRVLSDLSLNIKRGEIPRFERVHFKRFDERDFKPSGFRRGPPRGGGFHQRRGYSGDRAPRRGHGEGYRKEGKSGSRGPRKPYRKRPGSR